MAADALFALDLLNLANSCFRPWVPTQLPKSHQAVFEPLLTGGKRLYYLSTHSRTQLSNIMKLDMAENTSPLDAIDRSVPGP